MRRTAPFTALIVIGLALGCSTMRPPASQHPGITERNPNAITRTFPASATLVAQKLEDIMAADPILDNVAMTPDTASKEFRNFSKADRQALGISRLPLANDVNFNIKAKCKDGSPVAVTVRIKGESGSEVSVLYGFGGEPDLSRDLLDKVAAALPAPPTQDEALARTAGSTASAREAAPR